MQIDDFVWICDDAFDSKELNKLVRFCNRFQFADARVLRDDSLPNQATNALRKQIRDTKSYSLYPTGPSLTEAHWHNFFKYKLNEFIKKNFLQRYKHCTLTGFYEFTILKYAVGGHYVDHVDHAIGIPRNLSVIVFLNDNYMGGELEFFKPDMSSSKIIKPKTGRTIIWPSNFMYPHKVIPVTSGTRYTLVSWAI